MKLLEHYSRQNSANNRQLHRSNLAALITSKARIKLYAYIHAILSLGRSLLYCDIDSLFFSRPSRFDFTLLPDFTAGKHEFISKAVFLKPRCYAFIDSKNSEQTHASSFRKNSISYDKLVKVK